MQKVGKKDIVWSYASQILTVLSGLIVLPMVLRLLSAQEIGFNYILLSIGALVGILEGGFVPQFAMNVSYVFSGAQKLIKEGVPVEYSENASINYCLLSKLLSSIRWLYSIAGIASLILLLGFGTWYVYGLTEGFTNISNVLYIWLIFVLSVFFQIYYSYYNGLLQGAGLVKKARQASVYSQIFKIIFSYLVLSLGWGLLGVVIVYLLTPFVNRIYSYYSFFTKEIKENIRLYTFSVREKKEMFGILWYNGKKSLLSSFCGYLVANVTTLLVGSYLGLQDVASFGLMVQFLALVRSAAYTLIGVYLPTMASCLVKQEMEGFKAKFSMSFFVYYSIFVFCSVILLLFGEKILQLIGSNVLFPNTSILLVFILFRFLDFNFWEITIYYRLHNTYPFIKSAIITAVSMTIITYISLKCFNLGLWGAVLSVGFCQLVFIDWYWMNKVLKDINESLFSFLKIGFVTTQDTVKRAVMFNK